MRRVIWKGDYELAGKVARSQRGELRYQTRTNSAWYAPDGANAALNFQRNLTFVRGKSGPRAEKTTFQIHTRCTAVQNEQTRTHQSVFGGAAAIVHILYKGEDIQRETYDNLVILYNAVKAYYKSWRAFLAEPVNEGLKSQSTQFTWRAQHGESDIVVRIANPWVSGSPAETVTLNSGVIYKFAPYLCRTLIKVDGKTVTGSPNSSQTWAQFVDSAFNNGDFTYDHESTSLSTPVLWKGKELYLSSGGRVNKNVIIYNNEVYTTPPNE